MTGATRSTSRAGYGTGAFALVFTLLAAFSGSEAYADSLPVLGRIAGNTGAGSNTLNLRIPEHLQKLLAEEEQFKAASRSSVPDHTGAGMIYAPNLYGIEAPVPQEERRYIADLNPGYGMRATDTAFNQHEAIVKGQVGTWQQVKDGFGGTAIAGTIDLMTDEGIAGGFAQIGHKAGTWLGDIVGVDFGASNYNKQEHADLLLKDMPVEYWDSIMQYDDLGAAQRARGRILADLERQHRMELQRGASSSIASFIGKLPDYLLGALAIYALLLLVRGARKLRDFRQTDWRTKKNIVG